MSIGQTPANDPHWQLNWSDEFYFLDYSNKWKVKNNTDFQPSNSLSRTVFASSCVDVSNGNLNLSLKKESYSCPPFYINPNPWDCSIQYNTGLPYNYQVGGVSTKDSLKYGFIEARIKIPFVRGMFPAFWTFLPANTGSNNHVDEIDIFEMIATINPVQNHFLTPDIVHTNTHDFPGGNVDISNPEAMRLYSGFSFEDWHTYGIEWDPLKITWYIDGCITRVLPNHNVLGYQVIILNHGVFKDDPPAATNLPKTMSIDYVRIYKLKKDCNTVLNVCNYNFANHDKRLKKSITIGNNSCLNTLSVGNNVHLRAVEGILIRIKSYFCGL